MCSAACTGSCLGFGSLGVRMVVRSPVQLNSTVRPMRRWSDGRLALCRAGTPSSPLTPLFRGRFWLLFKDGELNLLLYRINPVHQNPHAIAHAVGLAGALADDLARVFVVGVAVVG